MIKLLEAFTEEDISPNSVYLLYCLKNRTKPKVINMHYELRILWADKLIDEEHNITSKGFALLEKIESKYDIDNNKIKKKDGLTEKEKEFIKAYREIFPKGNLPSGSPARSPIKELEKKFLWFKSNYTYSWETILKATKKYVQQYEAEGYLYMKNSSYFIYKSGIDRTTVSVLASYCDIIVDEDPNETKSAENYAGAI
jgi:hypothetical protein